MIVDVSGSNSLRLNPAQELKLSKPDAELYVGQVLKTTVVKAIAADQVLININGQNINAKTAHHFSPGELLQVKVMALGDETVLQVLAQPLNQSVLQAALRQVLPKQTSANQLLATLQQLQQHPQLPPALAQQIRHLLAQITPLGQLPQHLSQAVHHAGLFWESHLLNWRKEQGSQSIHKDFKGNCLKLFANLSMNSQNQVPHHQPDNVPLPLAGAKPQPLPAANIPDISLLNVGQLQELVHEQIQQVLARITALQINHLQQPDGQYQILFDLPIKTPQGVEVIPIQISHQAATPTQAASWLVACAVNLPNLGEIQASLRLAGQQLDIKFNAAKGETVNQLSTLQAEVMKQFKHLGLVPGHYLVQQGLEDSPAPKAHFHLLDIKI
jgi:hypothetical protein